MSKGTVQIGTRAIFTLIIVLVALSESLGAENILGAFLAGVLVSLLSPNKEMVEQLDSFGYGFLIPIFFVMVGVKLDIWTLFQDPKTLTMIPLLLLALFISKMFPVFYLKKWYDKRTVFASGFLLTSTLSLVIAAATIGERLHIISANMSGALTLVAVIASIITPIGFKKLFKRQSAPQEKKRITFIGANQMTLPVTLELPEEEYEVRVVHVYQENAGETLAESVFSVDTISDYEPGTLESHGIFKTDILVVATGNEDVNAEIALLAKEKGTERIIASVGSVEHETKLKEEGISIFSILLSTKTLLRALIEAPGVMSLLTNEESSLYQINLENPAYNGIILREFPLMGDVIFVRIFRGVDSIVPHGDTRLKTGDRLIVTGSRNYVSELRKILEA